VLLFASHGPVRPRETGTYSGLRLLRASATASYLVRNFGSLKTEEKTERQCGQRWNQPRLRSWVEPDAVLSIQKSPGSQPGAQIKKSDERYQHTFFPCDVLSSQQYLLESLILAQDERWRRA
jgi:hypothetical protein